MQSQADAPLQWLSIQNNGYLHPQRDSDSEAWGVIEIGHYTTDFALCDRGSMMEYAAISCAGMHLVYDGMSSALAQAKLPTSLTWSMRQYAAEASSTSGSASTSLACSIRRKQASKQCHG